MTEDISTMKDVSMTENKSTMEKVKTYKIMLWGVVQGVGFRPFIAKLAERMRIKGEVRNTGGLVEIILTGSSDKMEKFLRAVQEEKPNPAEIVYIKTQEIQQTDYQDFQIRPSTEDPDQIAMFPPDLAVCPACAAEAANPANPRYKHPFISCMVCGPRYTIVDKLPYDRKNTAMVQFNMCMLCAGEYTDSKQRRYHAQTISCHDCGPSLQSRGRSFLSCGPSDAAAPDGGQAGNLANIDNAATLLMDGKIIALKGIGGYYFVCSAADEKAAANLRLLKGREEKPFAVMFKDIDQIKAYCKVNETEERLLTSAARPIVLLERADAPQGRAVFSPAVSRSSRSTGAFLPGMTLQTMLIERTGPLVMTSANISERPMIKDNEEMFAVLQNPLLDAVFYHEREIRVRMDDSVVRVIDGQPQITRRAKGYVPTPLYIDNSGSDEREAADAPLISSRKVLAAGGQLKSTFCLTKGPFAYMSQHFGDLEDSESIQIYEENILRMQNVFGISPDIVACDLHPGYFTTQYARGRGLPIIFVQHHHAHIASVMAEHRLHGPLIGVGFDGTGYGADGTIWGGEFLICQNADYERAAHLTPIDMIGGDTSMKQGWKSAMCYAQASCQTAAVKTQSGALKARESAVGYRNSGQTGPEVPLDMPHRYENDPRYDIIQKALRAGINAIRSSSMGRLFDAVAALSGIHEVNRYEGECAIMLENNAAAALEQNLPPVSMDFTVEDKGHEGAFRIGAASVIRAVAAAEQAGIRKESIALGFHLACARMVVNTCRRLREERGLEQVALSGGVFQNKILTEQSLMLLREAGFTVYCNRSVPPGDGGIALGQAYIAKHTG